MSEAERSHPRARPATVLRLCRQCVEYVYRDVNVCPHCGGDPAKPSERYRAEGLGLIEAMQSIDEARARR